MAPARRARRGPQALRGPRVESPEAAPGCELAHQRAWPADVDQALARRAPERDFADVPARQPLLRRLDDDVFVEAGRLRADLGPRPLEQQPESPVQAVAKVEPDHAPARGKIIRRNG